MSKKIRILIADDFSLLREDLSELINGQPDMEVVGEAASGKEIVSLAGSVAYDLILMDIEMEVMNAGIIATQRIREENPEANIIFLTAHETREIIVTAMGAGASDYLVKGCDDQEILYHIRCAYEGVNRIADMKDWASHIIRNTQDELNQYDPDRVEFAMYFPEAHLLGAVAAKSKDSRIKIGCQSVYREDVSVGGNFGAFTANRPAAAMASAGCETAIIGHCEERNDKAGILAEAGFVDTDALNRILNKEIKCAINQGMTVLYCIGEKSEEQDRWMEVLGQQLELGLKDVDTSKVVIAYEPIWSIGPGKTPADKDYIIKIARFVKEKTNGMDIVYGGGLKQENAAMLASIDEIDGGLIALTRFQGEIGFYPEEYLEIIKLYMESTK